MASDAPVSPAVEFLSLLPQELRQLILQQGWPAYRADQLRNWVYQRLIPAPAEMTTFSVADRGRLAGLLDFAAGKTVRRQTSVDGTEKLLIEWPDRAGGAGAMAETVLIPDDARRTACVSSQVGCPVGCRFCASGMKGLQGNLSAGQIVEQIFWLNTLLKPAGERITNVVFMGMGEPMANYANVMKAIRILHDPGCFNVGARRITVSTVGVPQRIIELAGEELPVNLAISLHAPNEPLRKQLIPWAEHFSLDDILGAAQVYFDRTGREITLEYILLAGVNDRQEHARELARVCKRLRANVNLIYYNEVEGIEFRRPASADVLAFQQTLRAAGVNAHIRKSRGREIDAACGQLRRKHEDAEQEPGAENVERDT